MNKFEKEYDKTKDNIELSELDFYQDLIKNLISQDLFYKIHKIDITEDEKNIKYTTNIVFVKNKDKGKKYIGKSTLDDSSQIPFNAKEVK